MPRFSVIIPTYNRVHLLGHLLASLEGLDLHQVLVCDDGSSDGTRACAESWLGRLPLQYLTHERRGARPAAARNLGLRQADGDIALFLDDDVIASAELLQGYAALWQPGVSKLWLGVRRRVKRWPSDEPGVPDLRALHPLRPGESLWTFTHTCNCAASLPCPEFEESFVGWGCEDIEWGFRLQEAGFKLEFRADLEVWHIDPEGPQSPSGEPVLSQEAIHSDLINHALMLRLHPQSAEVRRRVWLYYSGFQLIDGRPRAMPKGGNPMLIQRWAQEQLALRS